MASIGRKLIEQNNAMKFKFVAALAILLVIWGFDSPTQADTTIFIHNLSSGVTIETPEGFVWDESPQTDGDLTVLTRYDGTDREVFVYDASFQTYEQITDNDLEDRYPRISGNNITWVGGEGQASEIFLASYVNGAWISANVSDNSNEDSFPEIRGSYLVWQGRIAGDWEIFLYNITTGITTQITDNDYGDVSPHTDGNYVVWLGLSYSGGEIFLYDIFRGKTTQITNDTNLDSPPQIAGGRVVWTSHEVTESVEPGNIFLHNIATEETQQLTNNTSDDSFPRINDESVIWVEADVEQPIEPSSHGSADDNNHGGLCFIATAAFGTYMHPHVQVIKDFRDEYLLTNMPGRWFVGMYNTYGPFWADFLNAHPRCKPFVRLALMPVVGISYFVLNTSLAMKLLTGFLLLGFLPICLLRIHGRSVTNE